MHDHTKQYTQTGGVRLDSILVLVVFRVTSFPEIKIKAIIPHVIG
jgi:hypothetical protein